MMKTWFNDRMIMHERADLINAIFILHSTKSYHIDVEPWPRLINDVEVVAAEQLKQL